MKKGNVYGLKLLLIKKEEKGYKEKIKRFAL